MPRKTQIYPKCQGINATESKYNSTLNKCLASLNVKPLVVCAPTPLLKRIRGKAETSGTILDVPFSDFFFEVGVELFEVYVRNAS